MAKKKNKMVAFWPYDLFPYHLWGEIDTKITPILSKGKMSYYVPDYQGFVSPKFILEGKEAEETISKLQSLKANKCYDDDVTYKKYKDELDDLISGLG